MDCIGHIGFAAVFEKSAKVDYLFALGCSRSAVDITVFY